MAKAKKLGALTEAAVALDAALGRFDDLCAAVKRAPLTSRKHIERAARGLQEAADNQQHCAAAMQALSQALSAAHERYQESAALLTARAADIQARAAELEALTGSFQAVAVRAAALNGEMRELNRPDIDPAAIRAKLTSMLAALEEIAHESDELRRRANAAELTDIAREADSLHQTVAAARKKIAELAPS